MNVSERLKVRKAKGPCPVCIETGCVRGHVQPTYSHHALSQHLTKWHLDVRMEDIERRWPEYVAALKTECPSCKANIANAAMRRMQAAGSEVRVIQQNAATMPKVEAEMVVS